MSQLPYQYRHYTTRHESAYIDLMWQEIEHHISQASGQPFQIKQRSAISGGCINQAWQLEDVHARYFIKLNSADRLAMFEAESDGLQAIIDTGTIKAPRPLCTGTAAGQAYLVMSHINTSGSCSNPEQLGQQLAAMHQSRVSKFGWHRENTIGSTPQHNGFSDSWIDFWRDQRLGVQYELATRNGCGGRLLSDGEKLMECFGGLFDGYSPQPSLLHGDLWSGNYTYDSRDAPVIFDPACYHGDREADIAMTELFGGFPQIFYSAYQEAWPLDNGYAARKTLYNLYHILNHFNLFGGGYLSQAESMTRGLLSELR